jgi:exosortase
MPILAAGLIWTRRNDLGPWTRSCAGGLALAALGGIAHVGSVWADIEFGKSAGLLIAAMGAVWYFGGPQNLRVCAGPMGLIVFMIPWPTSVSERLAFPMQSFSTSYGALMGGLCGLPLVREGVQLHVVPDPSQPPVYSVIVARQCSGLTSMMVLLALAYLVAYLTPTGWLGRLAILSLVAPLGLLANSLRLLFIILAGAHHGEQVAQVVHDNEAPILIVLCSLGLIGARALLLRWQERRRQSPDATKPAALIPPRRGATILGPDGPVG